MNDHQFRTGAAAGILRTGVGWLTAQVFGQIAGVRFDDQIGGAGGENGFLQVVLCVDKPGATAIDLRQQPQPGQGPYQLDFGDGNRGEGVGEVAAVGVVEDG